MSLIVRADFFYFIQFNLQLRISFYLLGKKVSIVLLKHQLHIRSENLGNYISHEMSVMMENI